MARRDGLNLYTVDVEVSTRKIVLNDARVTFDFIYDDHYAQFTVRASTLANAARAFVKAAGDVMADGASMYVVQHGTVGRDAFFVIGDTGEVVVDRVV